jgi:hypothetical protein
MGAQMSVPSADTRYPLPELLRIMRENHVLRLKMGGMEIECYPSGFITPGLEEVKPSLEKSLGEDEMPTGKDMLFLSGTNPFTSDEPFENPFLPKEDADEVTQ